jgi:hypothetical protein
MGGMRRRSNVDQLRLFPELDPHPAPAPSDAPESPVAVGSPQAEGPSISLVRSSRRRSTYKWSLINGEVRLEIPAGLPTDQEERILADVFEQARERLTRAGRSSNAALMTRARDLAREFLPDALPRLRSVAWSDRQGRRWGSCTVGTGAIRLSSRLHLFPDYVLEAVLVHELSHLIEPNHSPAFYELANRYPLHERARGFLEAVDRELLGAADDWDGDVVAS